MLRLAIVLSSICVIHKMAGAFPLPWKMVDLTYAFDEHSQRYPIFRNFNMTVVFNGTTDSGVWIQTEEYVSSTHAGTHMDAPSHFIPGGASIDQIPLTRFIGPAAVVDIAEKASVDLDAEVTVDDLIRWENIAGQTLDDTIVLMRSGWGRRYGDKTSYIGTSTNDVTQMRFPGISPDAARWMVENRRVKGVGVDTLSLDRGMSTEFWSHRTLLGSGIFILENVANLEDIPVFGALLYVMPMKIAGASGAPTRVVATYPEVIFST